MPDDIEISGLQEVGAKSIIAKGLSGMFHRTDQLRFVQRGVPVSPGIVRHARLLQQAWTNARGDVEWKDVPTWDEASETWIG